MNFVWNVPHNLKKIMHLSTHLINSKKWAKLNILAINLKFWTIFFTNFDRISPKKWTKLPVNNLNFKKINLMTIFPNTKPTFSSYRQLKCKTVSSHRQHFVSIFKHNFSYLTKYTLENVKILIA